MYIYLKTFYDQWCCGQDNEQIISRSEVFIDMVCNKIGLDKEVTRQFLYKETWFKRLL